MSRFHEKLSPVNRVQGITMIFREITVIPWTWFTALGRHVREMGGNMGSNMQRRYIRFRNIHDRDISGVHCIEMRPAVSTEGVR